MELRIGDVTHYYNHIGVAVLVLTGELSVGDTLHFQGATTEFNQPVDSLEIEHHKVNSVGPGTEVALKVNQRVRQGDRVFKVSQ